MLRMILNNAYSALRGMSAEKFNVSNAPHAVPVRSRLSRVLRLANLALSIPITPTTARRRLASVISVLQAQQPLMLVRP